MVVVVGATVGIYLLWQIPLPAEEPPLLQTSFICSADVGHCDQDTSVAQLTGGVDRVSVSYDRVPDEFVLALIATEDRDFFGHGGVSPVAVARALWSDLNNDSLRQGGSTITQQYVKNAYLTSDRTWERKVREAVLAVKLERELAKQEILERYLNTIYWGRGAYGIQAAARTYFGKDVEELGLAESAYLAGIIRAPESADAQRPPEDPLFEEQRRAATARRAAVLDAMVDEGYITDGQRQEANDNGWDDVLPREEATNYGRVARPEIGTEHYVDYVRRWLVDSGEFTDEDLYGGGLRIYTTLDLEAQEAAADAVRATLHQPDDPDAALVAIDERGAVRAMVGGFDFQASQVNLAVGNVGGGTGRQPGSSFKPIVLAAALEQGMALETSYHSPSSLTIDGDGGVEDWEVSNYADGAQGTLTLVDATRLSSNTAYAQLMAEVGPAGVVELAQRLGIRAEVPALPSIVLGTAELSVLDMATAFSVFANRGELVDPYPVARVTDAKGTVLWEADAERERVLEEEVADSVNWTLEQVIRSGTGTAADIGQSAAGKTGTTENHRDAWFVGYTCRFTAAVWVGYAGEQNRFMDDVRGAPVAGGGFPAEIWRAFMERVSPADEECEFERPQVVSSALGQSATTTPLAGAGGGTPNGVAAPEPVPEGGVTDQTPVEDDPAPTTAAPTTAAPPTTAEPPPTTEAPPPEPPTTPPTIEAPLPEP